MFDLPHFSVEVFTKWKDLLKETPDTNTIPSSDE